MIAWASYLLGFGAGLAAFPYGYRAAQSRAIRRLTRAGMPDCLARALIEGRFTMIDARFDPPRKLPDWLEGDIK